MSDGTGRESAIVIEREFDAPVELIWRLWTEPGHFKKWYGPQGFSVPVAEMDVRAGGRRLVCMEMQRPDGSMRMWTTGEHTEVVPNQRLVYTESMADEQGNVVAMPGSGHPMTTIVTVTLEDLGGRTRMMLTHAGMPASEGASAGWEQAFAKMADYLDAVLTGES